MFHREAKSSLAPFVADARRMDRRHECAIQLAGGQHEILNGGKDATKIPVLVAWIPFLNRITYSCCNSVLARPIIDL